MVTEITRSVLGVEYRVRVKPHGDRVRIVECHRRRAGERWAPVKRLVGVTCALEQIQPQEANRE
jgi:hypothetical protein